MYIVYNLKAFVLIYYGTMLSIVLSLIVVRLRKFLPKKDITAIVLFIVFYLSIAYILVLKNSNRLYLILVILDIIFYHLNRKDLNFLKKSGKYRLILFIEYFVYISPIFLFLIIDKSFLSLAFLVIPFLITYLPKVEKKAVKLPFYLFTPIWHIYFRRYKGIIFIILPILILISGEVNSNANLIYSSVFFSLLFPIIINFENINNDIYILLSKYKGRDFIYLELKYYLINLFVFNLLYVILYVFITFNIESIMVLLVVYCVSSSIIIVKYLPTNNLVKSFIYLVMMCTIHYGSFLIIPYLFNHSLKKIQKIQCLN